MINKFIEKIFRLAPYHLAIILSDSFLVPKLRDIALSSIRKRTVTIPKGVGKGLKFNCGNSNPEYSKGINELPVQKAIAEHLCANDVFYDIGAHIGFFSLISAKMVGTSGHIYAFEPSIHNAKLIRQNVKLNNLENITIIEKAVSESEGVGKLLLTDNPGGHTLEAVGNPENIAGVSMVGVVTVDNMVFKRKIKPPKLVKIDVEGAEIEVLRGMDHTISKYRPIIVCEIDSKDKSKFDLKQKRIQDFLESKGYKIKTLKNSYPGIKWYVKHSLAIFN
jgi:FkbM family methyltransferase